MEEIDDLDLFGFAQIFKKFNINKLRDYLIILKEKGYNIADNAYFYFLMFFNIYLVSKKHTSDVGI
jgi:hypothetical protein